jgi:hypothetical protein
MAPKRKLLFVQGDVEGAAGMVKIYWPLFLRSRLREHPGYEHAAIYSPSVEYALWAMTQADAVVFYGHRYPGGVWLGSRKENLTESQIGIEEVRKLRSALDGRRLDFVHIACCDTLRSSEWIEAWLAISEEVTGFDEITYDIRRPLRIPKAKTIRRTAEPA